MSKKEPREKMQIIMSSKSGMPICIVTYKGKKSKFYNAILELENKNPDDHDWTTTEIVEKLIEHKLLTGWVDIVPKKHILWVGEPDADYFD